MMRDVLAHRDEIAVANVRRAFEKGKIDNPLFRASDGLEALEMLRGDTVPCERRLVLLDINMPRMDGIEFLRELRADPDLRKTAVVVLTTSDAERDRIEAYGFNVAGYLVKPLRFVAFVELMTTLTHYWTLMDNYEWNHGMGALHMGLYAVDKADPTKTRKPRKTVATYATIAEAGEVPEDLSAIPIAGSRG